MPENAIIFRDSYFHLYYRYFIQSAFPFLLIKPLVIAIYSLKNTFHTIIQILTHNCFDEVVVFYTMQAPKYLHNTQAIKEERG